MYLSLRTAVHSIFNIARRPSLWQRLSHPPPAPRGSLLKQAGSLEPRSIPEIPERYIDMQTPVKRWARSGLTDLIQQVHNQIQIDAATGSFLTASSSCSRRLRRRRRWSGRCRSVRIIWLEHLLQYAMHAHGHALCQDSVSGAFVDPELKHLRSSLNSYIEGAHDNLEKFLEDLQTVTSTLAQDEQYR